MLRRLIRIMAASVSEAVGPAAKRSTASSSSSSEALQLGTHDGSFHCDEALAIYMLRTLPQYAEARLVRSRDPAVLQRCHIVVDVGGTYEPEHHRYDHHQRSVVARRGTWPSGKWTNRGPASAIGSQRRAAMETEDLLSKEPLGPDEQTDEQGATEQDDNGPL